MNTHEGVWMSINEYSYYKNISISTIRRRIKNKIIKFKEENGKYFIFTNKQLGQRGNEQVLKENKNSEIEQMRQQINKLHEENNELKMLIELYEMHFFKEGNRFLEQKTLSGKFS